jgi:hypothetical protein
MVDRNHKSIQIMRDKYSHLHELLFHRSLEKAASISELYDILDSVPTEYPLIWCDKKRRWITTDDIYLESKIERKV